MVVDTLCDNSTTYYSANLKCWGMIYIGTDGHRGEGDIVLLVLVVYVHVYRLNYYHSTHPIQLPYITD